MGDRIMNRIKPIKSQLDYEDALNFLEELVSLDPDLGTDEADQLSILAILIEKYEENHFPLETPSAVDAIKFRMDQLDLRPADLVPYLGSASRVSEILAGKRMLTVDMINALSAGLGIPEKALLKREKNDNEFSKKIPPKVFKQMLSRGYFEEYGDCDRPELLAKFFSEQSINFAALYRKSKFRTSSSTNHYILLAWANRVLKKADMIKAPKAYINGVVDLEYMRNIAKYSADEKKGVNDAISKLLEDGIKVVIEPSLDGSKLDGIAIFEDENHPTIGLTLRYDRLDNFWFSLMHELAHIAKHNHLDETFFYDDFEEKDSPLSNIEMEADNMASEALIENAKWLVSAARIAPSKLAVYSLAQELNIHPVIIAGKARYETGKWTHFSKMVKEFTVREYFKDIVW